MSQLHNFIFSYFPYLALIICFIVTVYRFHRLQSAVTARSSQWFESKKLILGSNLFHAGIIMVLIGHFVGILTPPALYEKFLSPRAHLIIAMVGGGVFGTIAIIGAIILLFRRLSLQSYLSPTKKNDLYTLIYLILMLLTGMSTLPGGLSDTQGESLVAVSNWAWAILTFHLNAGEFLLNVSTAIKIHIFLGMILILISPFTRLIHVWAAPLFYLTRAYKILYRGR